MKSTTSIFVVSAAFFVPAFAFAAVDVSFGLGITIGNVCTNTLCAVAQNILYLINNVLVPLLFAIAFIVFLYGIAKAYIFSAGDPEAVKQGHKLLLWGIIAFVVMISIWGLVNVVANTFGLAGYYAPPTPSSISPYGMTGAGGTTYVECPKDASGNCI
ncbi:MAG: pilin [Candidatus Parcubacteria bacterium]|nr:pilin [Candidatus Parcubacteria bacterium]